jgi:hypothetical protein
MANTREPDNKTAITHVVKSSTVPLEMNQIVVRAWVTRDIADISNSKFSDDMYVLISSKTDYILLANKKERGDHYQLSIERVNDNLDKIPKNSKALYTYSFYTLDPNKLMEHFLSIKEGKSAIDDKETNPERLLLKQAWGFLSACGMNKLIAIEDAPSSKFFSYQHNPVDQVRKVRSSCFSSINSFGADSGKHLGWSIHHEKVPHPSCLLANAKLAEEHKIHLLVPEETRVKIEKESAMRYCNIL